MKTNPELESDAESSEEHEAEKLSSASSDAASDAEDVFKLAVADEGTLPGEYKTLFLYRWQKAATELKVNHLRSDLTLPMDPTAEHKSEVWKNVDDGVVLPTLVRTPGARAPGLFSYGFFTLNHYGRKLIIRFFFLIWLGVSV